MVEDIGCVIDAIEGWSYRLDLGDGMVVVVMLHVATREGERKAAEGLRGEEQHGNRLSGLIGRFKIRNCAEEELLNKQEGKGARRRGHKSYLKDYSRTRGKGCIVAHELSI